MGKTKTMEMREPTETDTALWITRMARDGNDRHVARLYYTGDAARGVFEHARRLPGIGTGVDLLVPGAVLVTLELEGGNALASDDPLVVPPDKAQWFVRTWLKLELDEIDGETRRFFRT